MNGLDLKKIIELPIADIASVYGGVRGRTLSSQNQFLWRQIKEAGVKTVIDLREGGSDTRIVGKCNQNGLDYFYYPVDTQAGSIRKMVELFPEFCKLIDEDCFYIACAMGLHRTDIALCCYWMFYAADKGIAPPAIRGYRKEDGHNPSKIMRILNAMYKEFEINAGTVILPMETFKSRKKIIEARCAELGSIIAGHQLDGVKSNHKMELSIEEKRKVIDNVQLRINEWIGRSDMTLHEAMFLKGKHYPFKIQINPPLPTLIVRWFEQPEIKYPELFHLIKSDDIEKEEESLFRYTVENFLTFCFGG